MHVVDLDDTVEGPLVVESADCKQSHETATYGRWTANAECANAMRVRVKIRQSFREGAPGAQIAAYRKCYLDEVRAHIPLRGSSVPDGNRVNIVKRTILASALVLAVVAAHAQSVVTQHGNLVYVSASGATELLTETGADGSPVISPDRTQVAFTRLRPRENTDSNDLNSGSLSDVYVIRISDHALTKIVTAAHSAHPENELSGINSLKFSPDGSTLYFSTAAWVTSGAIHAVPVQGGHERFVTKGNGFAVVQHGKYAGYLVANQH